MKGEESTSKKKWAAIASCLAFVATGLFLLPDLISEKPAPSEIAKAPPGEVPATWPGGGAHPASLEHGAPRQAAAGSIGQSSLGDSNHSDVTSSRPPPGSFDCMIAPNETVDIGSSITGLIESIEVERSDFVEADQVIARLESRVEEAAVQFAKARAERTVELESSQLSYDLGKKRRSRANLLYEGKTLSLDLRDEVVTEAELAKLGVVQAEVNHELAGLQLQQAEAALARLVIRSPISGLVTERLMAPGEVVEQGTIMRVVQLDPLRVDVILPKHLFGSVKPGDEVEIVPEPPLNQPRTARVAIVDRTLDGASGTFNVRMELPNPDSQLPAGLRCQARISQTPNRSPDAPALPVATRTPEAPAATSNL